MYNGDNHWGWGWECNGYGANTREWLYILNIYSIAICQEYGVVNGNSYQTTNDGCPPRQVNWCAKMHVITWFNFNNPNMDKWLYTIQHMDEHRNPFPNFRRFQQLKFGKDTQFHPIFYWTYGYISMFCFGLSIISMHIWSLQWCNVVQAKYEKLGPAWIEYTLCVMTK